MQITERYQKELIAIQKVLEAYRKAAEKFIEKVESGRAFSRETYAELKEAVELDTRFQEKEF